MIIFLCIVGTVTLRDEKRVLNPFYCLSTELTRYKTQSSMSRIQVLKSELTTQ